MKAILADEFTMGGEGMKALAEEVASCAFNCGNNFKPLYTVWKILWSTKSKQLPKKFMEQTALYFLRKQKNQLKSIYELGLDKLPICMAKTQKSLSDDEKK